MSGFSLYQGKKTKNIKSWDQQNYLVIRGFCYIRPLYNEVPLYYLLWDLSLSHFSCLEYIQKSNVVLFFFFHVCPYAKLHVAEKHFQHTIFSLRKLNTFGKKLSGVHEYQVRQPSESFSPPIQIFYNTLAPPPLPPPPPKK